MADKIMEEYGRIANVRHVVFEDVDKSGSSPLPASPVARPEGESLVVGTAVTVPAGSPTRVTAGEKAAAASLASESVSDVEVEVALADLSVAAQ